MRVLTDLSLYRDAEHVESFDEIDLHVAEIGDAHHRLSDEMVIGHILLIEVCAYDLPQIVVPFRLEFQVPGVILHDAVDDGIGFEALIDNDIAHMDLLRSLPDEDDDVPAVEAVPERVVLELLLGDVEAVIDVLLEEPPFIEGLVVLHAPGDDSHHRQLGAGGEPDGGIDCELDEDESEDDDDDPAREAVLMPEEVPEPAQETVLFHGKRHAPKHLELLLKAFRKHKIVRK